MAEAMGPSTPSTASLLVASPCSRPIVSLVWQLVAFSVRT